MKQQRLLIAHQELTELNIERLNKRCDTEEVGSNLGDLRHRTSLRMEGRDHTQCDEISSVRIGFTSDSSSLIHPLLQVLHTRP